MSDRRTASVELHDDDGGVLAVRADTTTRGRAQAFFASEESVGFTEIRVRKTHYRFDAEWEREQREDGIEEPYDGWPMWECRADADGAVPYFKRAEARSS